MDSSQFHIEAWNELDSESRSPIHLLVTKKKKINTQVTNCNACPIYAYVSTKVTALWYAIHFRPKLCLYNSTIADIKPTVNSYIYATVNGAQKL